MTAEAAKVGSPNRSTDQGRKVTVVDSVTLLDDPARGTVAVCASHGGLYAAAEAARAEVRAVVLHDAGVGRDQAGIAGLGLLAELGIPAAAVDHTSARIGDGAELFERGIVSYVNGPAEALGCRPGMATSEVVERMAAAPEFTGVVPVHDEARHLLRSEAPQVWALDSASLAGPDDAGSVVVTGSHANLLGGRPATALKVDALAALYNDAGDRPPEGLTRLPALDARGIAAATVAASSARIGDAGSTYRDGVISAVNETARRLGCAPGMSAIDCVDAIVRNAPRGPAMTVTTTGPAPAEVADQPPGPRRMAGGRALAEMLRVHQVGPMFGMGGFQLLPFYNAVRELGLTHHLIDDERSGAFAADAQTRVTGRVGVCDATLGPGATNMVTALVEALNAGSPLVAIVGDTHRDHSWKNMTQEARQLDILRPAVKEVIRVEAGARIPELVRRAFAVASSGRPGPVVLAVPEDVAHGEFEYAASDFWADEATLRVPARRTRPDSADVERAAALLAGAERPLILAGGGIHLSGAYAPLLALAEEHDIPVAHTLSGKGSIACTHPLSVGLFGRYSRFANELLETSDGLLVVGCKLGEIATKRYALPPAGTRLIHLDISAEELGRTTRAEIGLWGDARAGLEDLGAALAGSRRPRADYLAEVGRRRDTWATATAGWYASEESPIHMARLIGELNGAMPDDSVLVADGGFASHWAGLLYDTRRSGRSFITDRGFASIGYGLPGSLGAQLGAPGSTVVGLTGDGGLNMTIGGLETARRAGAAFTLIVVNNAASGYVKALQHAVYGAGSYQSSDLVEMDYARIATAFGCAGIRVEQPADLAAALAEGIGNTTVPTVLDVVVTRDPAKMLPAVDSRTRPIKPGDRPA